MNRKQRLMSGSAKGVTGTLPFADKSKMLTRAVYTFNENAFRSFMAKDGSREKLKAFLGEDEEKS
jgi:hypothetical protein